MLKKRKKKKKKRKKENLATTFTLKRTSIESFEWH